MRVGHFLPLALTLTIALGAGCGTPAKKSTGTPLPTESPKKVEQVIPVRDLDLTRLDQEIRLLDWELDKTPPKPLSLSTKIENLNAGEALRMQISAIFRNEKGEIVGQSMWTEVTIPPQAVHQFAASTVLKKATDATLEFRIKEPVATP